MQCARTFTHRPPFLPLCHGTMYPRMCTSLVCTSAMCIPRMHIGGVMLLQSLASFAPSALSSLLVGSTSSLSSKVYGGCKILRSLG